MAADPPPLVTRSPVRTLDGGLARPRSVDDLLRGASEHGSHSDGLRVPALDELAESEVFVGSEDDEEDEEEILGISASSVSSLTASVYHDEARVPLHAVEEDVEAEEAEEAEMSQQMKCTRPPRHGPSVSGIYGSSSSIPVMRDCGSARDLIHSPALSATRSAGLDFEKNSRNRVDGRCNQYLSKSIDILDDKIISNKDGNEISKCNFHVGEVDLTDGIPNYVDYTSDERDHIDRSPCSEGSPLSVSLASSVASNMSIDDSSSSRTDTSSFTDTQDTVITIGHKNGSLRQPQQSSPCSNVSKSSKLNSGVKNRSKAGNKYSAENHGQFEVESKPRRVGLSPRLETSSRGQHCRGAGNASRSSPRLSDKSQLETKRIVKNSAHDRRLCRNTNGASTVASRSKMVDADANKKGKGDLKSECSRDSKLSEPKYSALESKKSEKPSRDDACESNTLGRRKKKSDKGVRIDTQSWLMGDTRDVEKYGTVGRKKKVREAGDGREETQNSLSKENKDTLDTYATLPRRRAREMSARWREQNLNETCSEVTPSNVPRINVHGSDDLNNFQRPLRRSRSIGKGETTRGGSSQSAGGRNTASFARNSPRFAPPRASPAASPRPTIATQTPRSERTIICLETAIQTAITGLEVASAMQALAKVRSQDEGINPQRPKVEIIRDIPPSMPPKPLPNRVNVCVQADGGWGSCRCGLRLDVGRSAEMEELQRLLAEERLAKEEVQGELDRTSTKIRDMLSSMEGVEKEFNERCDSLVVLESQLQHSTQHNSRLQDRLSQYEDYTITMKKDLTACQERERLLLQQVAELEAESRELAEFMSSEKEALTECLREAETEASRLRQQCEDHEAQIKKREQEAETLSKLAEERRLEMEGLESELQGLQGRTRDMMVCQGAQVSSAAVTLANLSCRLQALTGRLVHDYTVTEADLMNIVTPSESDSSNSSSSATSPQHGPPSPQPRPRGASSPRKGPASFIHAVLHALRGGPHVPGASSSQKEGRNSPDGSESRAVVAEAADAAASPSLVDQVGEVDVLLSRFLKVCCVLKADSDTVLHQLQEENERMCQEVRSQQQLIEQQQADYEVLSRVQGRVTRELGVLTRAAGKGNSDSQAPSGPDEAGAALLKAALKTLEDIPELVSHQPRLKHLLNSLRAHHTPVCPSASLVRSSENRVLALRVNDCDSNKTSENGGCKSPSNGHQHHPSPNGVGPNISTPSPEVRATPKTSLNRSVILELDHSEGILHSDHTSGSVSYHSNGSASLGTDLSNNGNGTPEKTSSTLESSVHFDLNANPPSSPMKQSSTIDCVSNPASISPLSSKTPITSPKMFSPSALSSPRGLTSPHGLTSPLLQRSPLNIAQLGPHPLLVQTETHL